MKVYYVANARLPSVRAYGIQLVKMCEAFVEAGVELELILPEKAVSAESIENFYKLRARLSLTRLPVINILPETRFGFNLAALTFALVSFFYILGKRWRRQDIIYTIDLDQLSFFLIPFLRMPYFFETHATKSDNALYRFFLHRARGIIAINEWIKNDLAEKFGVQREKILVFPNGIDMSMFDVNIPPSSAKRELGLPADRYAVIYIGRFYDWKGLHILIPAANFLPDKFVFYLVGGTTEQLKDILGVQKIPDNIKCVGEKKYEEIPLWLAAADALLVLGTKKSEYSYNQTSPMKLFEYMASKKPIVASRTPAIEEIVSEAEVWFHDPDDDRDLARAVRSVLEDRALAREKAESAYQKVISFSWLKRARTIINFIGERL